MRIANEPLRYKLGYLKAIWPEICGSVFGVWAAPGGFKSIQKGGGLRPPHFWMVLKPPGAAQTPKTDPKHSGQTAFRYPASGGSRYQVGRTSQYRTRDPAPGLGEGSAPDHGPTGVPGTPPDGCQPLFEREPYIQRFIGNSQFWFSSFRQIFSQTWPPNPSRTTGLVLQ